MIIPKKIKIGGMIYRVKIVNDLKDSAGEYNGSTLELSIGNAKPDSMFVTFLHEIIHAINSEIGEVETEFLAQALCQVIKDNPKIFEGVKKK